MPSPAAAPASRIAGAVQSRANGLNLHVSRLEKHHSSGIISATDVNRIYAGAYVSFHSYLENSIEDLFLGLVTGRLHLPGVKPLVAIPSSQVARKVVFGARNYADWLPFNKNTMPRADAFLSRGLPFSALAKADRNALDSYALMRNALAHESTHALKQFRRVFTDGHTIPPAQLRPAAFLRGQHTRTQLRFEYYLSQAVLIMRTLCT